MAEKKKTRIGRDSFRLGDAPITGIAVVVLFTLGVIMLPPEWLGDIFTSDPTASSLLGGALLRLIGFGALLWLRIDLGLTLQKPRFFEWLLVAPFLLVAVNNLPILALAQHHAVVTRPAWVVCVYAFWCLAVALIEETAFRGLVLPLTQRALKNKKHRSLWTVLLSSALFGLIHLVNLVSGAVLPVLAQVGYSFLIGCVCAVATLRTRNLAPAVLFHAVYNFCGLLIPTVGEGALWDVPTVVVTAVLAVAAAVYVLWVLLKTPDRDLLPARQLEV